MILTTWPCPALDDPRPGPPSALSSGPSLGQLPPEMAIAFAAAQANACLGQPRLLILPALFDEGNRLRRFTVTTMRPMETQDLVRWRLAAAAAAAHFDASHVLTIRAAACLAPSGLPGWHYAPHSPASQLRQLLRARTLASREAGIAEGGEGLLARGRMRGLELSGYPLGPAMIAQLHAEDAATTLPVIPQSALGGSGLWLRAEPGDDAGQSASLAAVIAKALEAQNAAPARPVRIAAAR